MRTTKDLQAAKSQARLSVLGFLGHTFLLCFLLSSSVSPSHSFSTRSRSVGLLWGSALANLFSTHIRILKASCIGICCAILLMPFPLPPVSIHSSLFLVSWERQGWLLAHLPAFQVGLVNGKHQQETRGKKEEVIPFPPYYGWVPLCLPTGTSDRTELCVSISEGCHDELLQTGGLKQQKSIISKL